MPREVTLDIETADAFADVGKYDPTLLHVSLVGVYDSGDDSYRSFLCEYAKDAKGQPVRDENGRFKLTRTLCRDYRMDEDDVHGVFSALGDWQERGGLTDLWQVLQGAERVIGYNIINFDYGVMDRYYPGGIFRDRKRQDPRFETLDLMVEIAKNLGFRAKLDDVASATLGHGKTGHGLQAIEFYRRGEVDKLSDYCLHDVKATWDVYRAGADGGQVKLKDRTGQLREIPVDFAVKAKKAVEMTLF
jgi:hypothetical protein